jgi:hypothetical protein
MPQRSNIDSKFFYGSHDKTSNIAIFPKVHFLLRTLYSCDIAFNEDMVVAMGLRMELKTYFINNQP